MSKTKSDDHRRISLLNLIKLLVPVACKILCKASFQEQKALRSENVRSQVRSRETIAKWLRKPVPIDFAMRKIVKGSTDLLGKSAVKELTIGHYYKVSNKAGAII